MANRKDRPRMRRGENPTLEAARKLVANVWADSDQEHARLSDAMGQQQQARAQHAQAAAARRLGGDASQVAAAALMSASASEAPASSASELERLQALEETLSDQEISLIEQRREIQSRIEQLEVQEAQAAWNDDATSWDVDDIPTALPDDQVEDARLAYERARPDQFPQAENLSPAAQRAQEQVAGAARLVES